MSEYMNNINPDTNNSLNEGQVIVDSTASENGTGEGGTSYEKTPSPRKPKNLKAGAMVAVAVCVAAALTITGVATNGFGLAGKTSTSTTTASSSDSDSSSRNSGSSSNTVKAAAASATDISETSSLDVSDMFTDRDLAQTWDESKAETITLSDGASSTSADGVTIDGDTITITKEGVYVLSGTLSDGQIIVGCEDEDAKVQLVLNGVTISNDSSAAIYIKSADKTFITTASGTTNTLSMTGSSYEAIDENNIDAVIFAKDDLTLNGEGTLNVTGSTGHGIVCKDDLKVTGGTYNITSPDHALNGKDSVRIAGGTLNLKTTEDGGDGIHSGNDEDDTKGWIYIQDGDITIDAADDGIHSGTEVRIDGGTINVTNSYEGIEGEVINVVDGTINVVSSDDGFNAVGGSTTEASDSKGFGGGMGGGMMDTDENAAMYFYGGTTTVDAGGDGLDSNGYLVVNGGTIYVSGPTDAGNGAIDSGISATINGGIVIAAGAAGMDENFGSDSTQGSIKVQTSSMVTGEVQLLDADGNVLASWTPTKQYSSVVISTAGIEDGSTYTVKTGSESTEVTMDGLIYGESSGMGGFGGGKGGMQGGNGGPGNGGQRPDMGSSSDGSSDGGDSSDGSGKMTPPDMNSNGSSDSSDGNSSDSGFGGHGGMTPPDMGSSDDSGSSDNSQRGPRGGRPGSNGSSDSNSSGSTSSDGSL